MSKLSITTNWKKMEVCLRLYSFWSISFHKFCTVRISEVKLHWYYQICRKISFGIQNSEVPEFRSIIYIENRIRNFGTNKIVWILEVSRFQKLHCISFVIHFIFENNNHIFQVYITGQHEQYSPKSFFTVCWWKRHREI